MTLDTSEAGGQLGCRQSEHSLRDERGVRSGGGRLLHRMHLFFQGDASAHTHTAKGRGAPLRASFFFSPFQKHGSEVCPRGSPPAVPEDGGLRPPTFLTIRPWLMQMHAEIQACCYGWDETLFQAPGRCISVAEPRLLCEAPEVALVGLKLLFASWAAQSDLLFWSLWKGFCMF